jgi:hypothetical protein
MMQKKIGQGSISPLTDRSEHLNKKGSIPPLLFTHLSFSITNQGEIHENEPQNQALGASKTTRFCSPSPIAMAIILSNSP